MFCMAGWSSGGHAPASSKAKCPRLAFDSELIMCKGLAAGNQARISAMPHGEPCRCRARRNIEDVDPPARSRRASPDRSRPTQGPGRLRPGGRNNTSTVAKNPATGHARHGNERDRKSVGLGKSVSVSVDPGGRRTIKKKKKK